MSSTNRWRLWALAADPLARRRASRSSSPRATRSPASSGTTRRPRTTFDIRRVEFEPGEIRIRVTNPQPEDLTIAVVTVDDAIVPFTLDGPQTLGRLRSSTIVVAVRLGRRTSRSRSASRPRPGSRRPRRSRPPSRRRRVGGRSVLGYALIGFLVGVVPIAFGLLWLPSLRRAAPQWLAAFMALTAGLLTFLALEALGEALELQAALPGGLGGPGLVLLGVAGSYLTLVLISGRFGEESAERGAPLGRARAGDAGRDRHRPAQPRRGARDRLVVRARRAGARHVLHRRLHGPQHHRGTRDRRPGRRGQPPRKHRQARRAGAHRRRARDPRRLARRVRDERLPRGPVLRRRRRRRARGRHRGRPLRRPQGPRRRTLALRRCAASSPGSRSCT